MPKTNGLAWQLCSARNNILLPRFAQSLGGLSARQKPSNGSSNSTPASFMFDVRRPIITTRHSRFCSVRTSASVKRCPTVTSVLHEISAPCAFTSKVEVSSAHCNLSETSNDTCGPSFLALLGTSRQLAAKEVRIEKEGRETELDKTIVQAIKDRLTHMVRTP
jgi:hypothetical protein